MGSVTALANHSQLAPKSGSLMWSTSWPPRRRMSAWVSATPAMSWTSAIRATYLPLGSACEVVSGLGREVRMVRSVLTAKPPEEHGEAGDRECRLAQHHQYGAGQSLVDDRCQRWVKPRYM